MSKQYQTGVFLARMQPLHVAHLFLIEQALAECEQVWVVLGSSNKKDMTRNPFTLEFRKEVLEEALADSGYSREDLDRIHMFELPDWSLENDTNETVTWGRYFYYNVVSRIQHKDFAIYYSDDSSIIKSWFESEVKDHITLRLFNRQKCYDGLSATRIREAIIKKDMAYLEQYCPKAILDRLDYISGYYKGVLDSPVADFSME